MEAGMQEAPPFEVPQFATLKERLARAIAYAREATSLRVGYEVEVAGIEPIEREGHTHIRVYWRPTRGSHDYAA